MFKQNQVIEWLLAKPFRGRSALIGSMVLVALPTALRQSLDDVITGLAVTPYIPFIILAALLLAWSHATVVAGASAIISDALFIGTRGRILEGPTDFIAIGFFMIAASMTIALVQAMRSMAAEIRRPFRAGYSPFGVVFSLEKGEAWASWYGSGAAVCLGPRNEVAEMMKDFLAQVELGERLANRSR